VETVDESAGMRGAMLLSARAHRLTICDATTWIWPSSAGLNWRHATATCAAPHGPLA
jgi:hypothetical protein